MRKAETIKEVRDALIKEKIGLFSVNLDENDKPFSPNRYVNNPFRSFDPKDLGNPGNIFQLLREGRLYIHEYDDLYYNGNGYEFFDELL